MRVNGLVKILTGTVAAATLGLATAAQAADSDIPGTGFGGFVGQNSGTDAFGQQWVWNTTGTGLSAWGVPGLGDNTVNGYNGKVAATDFFVSFLTSANNVFINTTPSTMPGGYDEQTRFSVCQTPTSGCVAWAPLYQPTVNPLEVNFFAPPGSSLVKGEYYFVNVIFTNGDLSGADAGFSAVFSSNVVPEAPTWAMMILGVAGVGGAMRSARRKQAASFIGA